MILPSALGRTVDHDIKWLHFVSALGGETDDDDIMTVGFILEQLGLMRVVAVYEENEG